jgi:hypothetical protein
MQESSQARPLINLRTPIHINGAAEGKVEFFSLHAHVV